jgi:integrase
MTQVLAEFAALPNVTTTADLTTATVARYVGTMRDQNPNTVNGHLDYLRTAVNHAIEEGWLDRPPSWRKVRPRPRAMTLNPPCTLAEVSRLLARLRVQATDWEGRRLHALTSLIVFTGLRRDEALYSHVEDLRLDATPRTFSVVERSRRLKTLASARTVPVHDAAAAVLSEWIPHALDAPQRSQGVPSTPHLFKGVRGCGPWTGGGPGSKPLDRLKQVAGEVGITRITWHGLRHTFGQCAVNDFDVPLWVVSSMMGHTDLRTTRRYVDLSRPALLARHMASANFAG